MAILQSIDLSRGTRRFQRFGRGAAAPAGRAPGGAPGPRGIFDPELMRAAVPEALRKLNPRYLIRNP